MQIVGCFQMTMTVLDHVISRPMYVISGLDSVPVILGIDFLREQQMVVDAGNVYFKKPSVAEAASLSCLFPVSRMVVPPRTVLKQQLLVRDGSGARLPVGTHGVSSASMDSLGVWDSLSATGDFAREPMEPESGPSSEELSPADRDALLRDLRVEASPEWRQKYLDLILQYHDVCSKSKFDISS